MRARPAVSGWSDVDALAPGLAVSIAAPNDPSHRIWGRGLGVAVTFHVGQVEAAAWMHPMLMEPCEAWPEIGPAASLDRDAVR